jgi:uncharacterized membrane protein YfcA
MAHIDGVGYLAVAAVGFVAGFVNTIVGSGSLVTFPTLVALGLSPYLANVTNNVGLSLGNISAIHGFRRELAAQRPRAREIAPFSLAGGATGAIVLLIRPGSFRAIVPWLVLAAVVLVLVQPTVAKALASRRGDSPTARHGLKLGVFLTGVYGGYFGAAQGVILIALLATAYDETMIRSNALKNLAAGVANLAAAVLFAIFAPVDWSAAGVLAATSVLGAQAGARVGRKLPSPMLRALVVVGGTAAVIDLLR